MRGNHTLMFLFLPAFPSLNIKKKNHLKKGILFWAVPLYVGPFMPGLPERLPATAQFRMHYGMDLAPIIYVRKQLSQESPDGKTHQATHSDGPSLGACLCLCAQPLCCTCPIFQVLWSMALTYSLNDLQPKATGNVSCGKN